MWRNGRWGLVWSPVPSLEFFAESPSATLAEELWPTPTTDGQWIYFTGRPGHQNGEIWRVGSDGNGAERIGPAAGFYDIDQAPAPSPDGSQVLYWSVRQGETTHHLRV